MFTKKVFFIYLSLALFNLQNINACQNPQCQQGSSMGAASQIAISQAITIGMFSIVGFAAYKIWNIGNLVTKADLADAKVEIIQRVDAVHNEVVGARKDISNLDRNLNRKMDAQHEQAMRATGENAYKLEQIADKLAVKPGEGLAGFLPDWLRRVGMFSLSPALSPIAAGSPMGSHILAGDGTPPSKYVYGNLGLNDCPFRVMTRLRAGKLHVFPIPKKQK